MRIILLAPLLLAACAGSWPAKSYVRMDGDADAAVFAPAVSDCVAEIVLPKSAISLASTQDALTPVLTDELTHKGWTLRPDGQAVSYIVAPLDAGEFIRVAAPRGACSQYFSRATGTLKPAGPIMVIAQ